MRRINIEETRNPKQYGFKSKLVKLYRQDEKSYFHYNKNEFRINDGTLNTLIEKIMYMTPEEAEVFFIGAFNAGKIKKL